MNLIKHDSQKDVLSYLCDVDFDDREEDEELSFERVFSIMIDKARSLTSACCFSEKNNSFVMWDRYSNGHKGICIEYDTSELIKNNGALFKVNYSEKAFCNYSMEIDPFYNLYLAIVGSLLTKNIEYSYEAEWRWFTSRIDIENMNGIGAVKAVFLGSRIQDDDADRLIALCNSLNIPVKRMIARNDAFRFEMDNC